MWHKVPDTLTIAQGNAIMERYNDVGRSWLCRRLRLPEPTAKNVRKFLKPEPVHFLNRVICAFGSFILRGVEIRVILHLLLRGRSDRDKIYNDFLNNINDMSCICVMLSSTSGTSDYLRGRLYLPIAAEING